LVNDFRRRPSFDQMTTRLSILIAVLAVSGPGCREPQRREPARQVADIEDAGSAVVASPRSPPDATPPPGSEVHADAPHADARAAAPSGPPPGTPDLVAVPPEIASKVALREVVRGLARPVLLVVAPGDPRKRMFIVEQRGRIRILENGKLRPGPLFTIGNLSSGNEQGLLGLAFHPGFATNGRLFVNYTSSDMATHIVEYRVSSADPDVVDPGTAREIIRIAQPFSNHNGGHLLFGPDGKLYTGMGDGGSAGDPHRNGQNPRSLLSKILRFDVDAARPVPEIVHLGLRNPWRFSFDHSGALYIGDVGQNQWESVFVVANDRVQHNFGWNIVEGNHCYRARDCDASAFTPAVADYPHQEGCSITGGVTYQGKALAMLAGRYFYADYCTGLLRSFVWTHDPSSPTAGGWIREHWNWKPAIDRAGVLHEISSFGVDSDGEIYLVLLTGAIYQLVPR
jgi:glucose/arabinose dehydrogenase